MKKMEEEDAREQEELRARIRQLEHNVREYENMINTWRERCREMEMACGRERQLRQSAEHEVEILRRDMTSRTDAVPLPPRQFTGNEYNEEQDAAEVNGGVNGGEDVPLTCGKCTIETRCACIEEAFEMGGIANEEQDTSAFKRPHSPQSNTDNKRPRQTLTYDPNAEIDFTEKFASRPRPSLTTCTSISSSIAATAPLDPCGFCSDGTSCICAELSKEVKTSNIVRPTPSLLPTLAQQSNAVTTSPDPCVKGPGTCAQCIFDPSSKKFCQSVAASRQCAKSAKLTSLQPNRATNSTLNCAAAFTMLSAHPSFDNARTDMSSWVPQLTAISKPAGAPERTAFDIEAASVMSVLRFFDRRFGSDARPTTPVSEAETDLAMRNGSRVDVTDTDENKHGGRFIAYDGEQGVRSVRGPDMRR